MKAARIGVKQIQAQKMRKFRKIALDAGSLGLINKYNFLF